jgi:hypothetical protein
MPLSRRSRLSLAEFLSLQPDEPLAVLLKKHNLPAGWPPSDSLAHVCETGDEHSILSVLDEVARTHNNLRSHVRRDLCWIALRMPFGDNHRTSTTP